MSELLLSITATREGLKSWRTMEANGIWLESTKRKEERAEGEEMEAKER